MKKIIIIGIFSVLASLETVSFASDSCTTDNTCNCAKDILGMNFVCAIVDNQAVWIEESADYGYQLTQAVIESDGTVEAYMITTDGVTCTPTSKVSFDGKTVTSNTIVDFQGWNASGCAI